MNDIDNKVAETAADNDRQLKKLKSANEIPPSKPSKDIGTLHYDSKSLWKRLISCKSSYGSNKELIGADNALSQFLRKVFKPNEQNHFI